MKRTGIIPPSIKALILSLLAATALIALFSSHRAHTLHSFFAAPFSNSLYLGELLHQGVLISLTGLAFTMAYKAGLFNLGGEGQAYCGVLFAVCTARILPESGGFLGIMLLLAAGCLGGGLLGFISAWFKAKWELNELITTFLLSAGVSRIIDYLIAGPLSDPESYLLTTAPLPRGYRIPSMLPPSSLNAGMIFPLVFLPLVWYLLNHTRRGYEIRITGSSREFARYGGLNTEMHEILSLSLSGALHGLAGALVLTGSSFAGIQGLTAGLGWNGIAVALISMHRIPMIIPAALFFSWLNQGAKLAVLRSEMSLELGAIIQGLLFLLISSRFSGKTRKKR